MKHNNDSLYWQNMQLYSYGVVFNALGLTINDFRAGMAAYTRPHVAIVFCETKLRRS